MLKIVSYVPLLLLFTFGLRAETLVVASDVWCPYICNNKENPGILVDALIEIARVKKLDIRFKGVSLSRSITMAQHSKVDIVLAVTESHILNYKLQSSNHYFGGWYNDIYIRKSDDWTFDSQQDIEDFLNAGETLGIIDGYEYGSFIDKLKIKYSTKIYQASGLSPLENSINMLQKGRMSAFLDSRYNVEYVMKKNNVDNIIYAGSEGDFVPLFLGYSPTTSPEVINSIDNGLLIIRKRGILKAILEKYGVPDWQQSK